MKELGGIGVMALFTYLFIMLVKFGLAAYQFRKYPETNVATGDITILQPILSGDPFLEQALRHNLQQADEQTHFLWLIDHDDSEGLRIGKALQETHQRISISICASVDPGVNPKTFKLQLGLDQVETTFIAVVDDDTMLSPESLGRALGALERSDLYTGLPCYQPGDHFWSSLVAHFVNNNSVLTYLPLLPLMEPLTINGMFYVMRRERLLQMGGFTPIQEFLCDDYALAQLVKSHNGVIVQGWTPQRLRTTVADGSEYWALMHRWFAFAKVLTNGQSFWNRTLLGIFLGLPPLLLWLGLLAVFAGPMGVAWLFFTGFLRHQILITAHQNILGGVPGFRFVRSLLAEWLQPWHWFRAQRSNILKWRKRRIELLRDGRFRYLPDQEL